MDDGSNNLRPGGHGVGEPSVVTDERVLSACVVRALPLWMSKSRDFGVLIIYLWGSWTLANPV